LAAGRGLDDVSCLINRRNTKHITNDRKRTNTRNQSRSGTRQM